MTGVQGKIELKPALDLALSLHPGTRRVVVVTGNSNVEKFWESLAHKEFQSFENRVQFTYLTNTTIDELRRELASLPPNTIVLFLNFLLDSAGNGYSLPESVSLVAPSSSAPIYVAIQSGFRPGVVGGHMISYERLAKLLRIGSACSCRGETTGYSPQTVPSAAIFNWKELRRWGIDENRLPAGSIIRDREFTFGSCTNGASLEHVRHCDPGAGIVWLLFTRPNVDKPKKEAPDLQRLRNPSISTWTKSSLMSRHRLGSPTRRRRSDTENHLRSPYCGKMFGLYNRRLACQTGLLAISDW